MKNMYPVTNLWYYIKRAYKILIHIISGIMMVLYLLKGELTSMRVIACSLVFFLAMHASYWLQIILHELGRFVCGLLSGYRFGYLQLFGFRLQKINGQLSTKRKHDKDPVHYLLAPPETDFKNFPVRLYFLGGFIANILFILIFLGAAFRFPGMSLPRFLFLQYVFISIPYVLIYGMPIQLSGARTETYNALTIPTDYRSRCAYFIPRLISYHMLNGIRLRDMPEEWFYLPTREEMFSVMHSRLASYYVDWLIEKGRYTEADAVIDSIYSLEDYRIKNIFTTLLFLNKIFLILVHTKKYEQMKTYLSDAQKKRMVRFGSELSVKRTQYIIALLYEKDMEKAAYLKSVFLASKSQFYPTEYESELELIEIAEACAKKEAENIE